MADSMVVSHNDTSMYSFPKLPLGNEATPSYAQRMGFGDRLRAAREAKELSGQELGRRLAVSKSTISHWENGRYEPSLGQLMALCDELATSADWLMERPGQQLSAEALQEARAFEALSPENRRKWRALRHTMFSTA